MSEFGHIALSAVGVHIDTWGSGPFVIDVDGKSYRFEDSDRFGPFLVAKDGRVLDRQPTERDAFWKAHFMWKAGGRRVSEDGVTAVWERWVPEVVRHIAGRHYVVAQKGTWWFGAAMETIVEKPTAPQRRRSGSMTARGEAAQRRRALMKVILKVELDLVFVDPDTGLADTDEEIEASDLPTLAESLEAYLKPDDDNYSSPDFLDGSGLFVGVTKAKVTLESMP